MYGYFGSWRQAYIKAGPISHKNEELLLHIVFCKQNLHASYLWLIPVYACMTLAFSLQCGCFDLY